MDKYLLLGSHRTHLNPRPHQTGAFGFGSRVGFDFSPGDPTLLDVDAMGARTVRFFDPSAPAVDCGFACAPGGG